MFNSISTKLVALFLIIGLIPVGFISYSSINLAEAGMKTLIKGQLYYALERSIGSLLDVFLTMQSKTTQVSSDRDLLEMMEKISQTPEDEETIQSLSEHLATQKEILSKPLSPTLQGITVMELTVANSQGVTIASTAPQRVGHDFSAEPEFFAFDLNAQKSASDLNDRLGYDSLPFAMIVPLRSTDDNSFLGVVMVMYPFKALQDAMQGSTYRQLLLANPAFAKAIQATGSIGQDLRIYGADANGKVTLPPAQDPNQKAAFKKVLNNAAIRACVDANTVFEGEYTGYDGEPAYGVNICSATRTSFIAEVPSSRAFATIAAAKAQIITSSLVVAALILLVGLLVARTITKPLKDLTMVVDNISKGDLTVEIGADLKNSTDEIGTLAHAFQRVLVSLKLAMTRKKKE